MGNDGGSIPDRRDLVKTKAKPEQADKANQTRARWFYCALSKRPLEEPIVSCGLGKLYNKDAILEYLINKAAFGDGESICGHIKSMKDVTTLNLTKNPSPSAVDARLSNASADVAQFVCPLTSKDMNGAIPFVYIGPCGCVMSQSGLKALTSVAPSGSTPPAEGGQAEIDSSMELCPVCSTKYSKKEDVRQLNVDRETEEELRQALEAKRTLAKANKKKRKAGSSDAPATTDADVSSKKTKPAPPAPSMHPSVALISRAVTETLAAEEAKRKSSMSDAVKSLYQDKNPNRKETFMTRGTFTRYA